ncbi:lysylphosphatidylglycerol synthase transmembrane domain-containing protein [Halalkalibaculum sp. DA3122]|uniref:lysylphosphatidylglycerol synthase transmembrane domain-containing protein n=1 Tax=unclassified Halalkalibaculum TaxID=2964617 RepID=UPI00375449DB
MLKKGLKIGGTIAVGGVFLWLAFRNVVFSEVWEYARQISFGWVLPFVIVAIISHYLRAERWKLLIEHDKKDLDRFTLFSGVMAGYMLNLVFPRLGEVTRPVYVAKREDLSSSKLIGTIVLERAIDLGVMAFLMFIVSVYLVTDLSLLSQIFGRQTVDFFSGGMTLETVIGLLLAGGVVLGLLLLAWKMLVALAEKFEWLGYWVLRLRRLFRMFWEGLAAAREVERWWLFVLLTGLIWVGYTLMSYIPFWMFDMQTTFDLSLLDALVITVISAIGIAIPSPGGVGTYHYFVKQTLLILFAVPAVTGIAYATVTHAAMVLMVSTLTPILLAVDKFRATKQGKPVV